MRMRVGLARCRCRFPALPQRITTLQCRQESSFVSFREGPKGTAARGLDRLSLKKDSVGSSTSPGPRSPTRPATRLAKQDGFGRLEALFAQTIAQQKEAGMVDLDVEAKSEFGGPAPLTQQHLIRRLNLFLKRGDHRESWDALSQDLLTAMKESARMEPTLQQNLWALHAGIFIAEENGDVTDGWPSTTQASELLHVLGILHISDWCRAMRMLLLHGTRITIEQLEDVVRMWRLVCCSSPAEGPDEAGSHADASWSGLTQVNMELFLKHCAKQRFDTAFALVMPKVTALGRHDLHTLSAAYCQLMADIEDVEEFKDVVNGARPLTKLLQGLISKCCAEGHDLQAFIANSEPSLTSNARRYIESVRPQTPRPHHVDSNNRCETEQPRARMLSLEELDGLLEQAVRHSSVLSLDELWARVSKTALPETKEGDPRIVYTQRPVHHTMMNRIIQAYLTLGKADQAVVVWNFMIAQRVQPSQDTWNAMLVGCSRARNAAALCRVWQKMHEAGEQPDTVCWTTYIQALCAFGPLDTAMRTIDEMGRRWLAAVQQERTVNADDLVNLGDSGKVPKPSTSILNVALAGLLKRNQPQSANQVLKWATSFGIKPNVSTYNQLLRPLIRQQETKKMVRLLRSMRQQGLQADIATFTMMLGETFRSTRALPLEQRLEAVKAMLANLDSHDIKADALTYGQVLRELLRESPRDETAMPIVYAVLAMMRQQGIAPTPTIHTMILSQLCASPRPNLGAVRDLARQAARDPASVDHIFWDRVVEGFATLGETTEARRVLDRRLAEGHRVSWHALRALLTALAERHRTREAQSLVDTVRLRYAGPLDARARGAHGQHVFWEAARSFGLAGEDVDEVPKR